MEVIKQPQPRQYLITFTRDEEDVFASEATRLGFMIADVIQSLLKSFFVGHVALTRGRDVDALIDALRRADKGKRQQVRGILLP